MRGGNRPAAPDPRESKGLSRGSAEGHYRKGCPADKATGGFLNLPNGFPPSVREAIAKDVRNHPMVASTDARLSGFERGEGHAVVSIDGKRQNRVPACLAIVGADKKGVTLYNPWGHNDPANGGSPCGGKFTIFRPGVSQFPAYNVSRVGVEEGEMVATLNGSGDKQGRGVHTARMRAGESVTDEVSGTFTLVEITPARYAAPGSREEFFGTRATAHFCYVPAPGFELGPMLNSKQRMRPPVRKSPAGGPPQTPTGGQPPSSEQGQSAG